MPSPTDWGAVAIEDDSPSSWGAIAVEESDPSSWGAVPVEQTSGVTIPEGSTRIPPMVVPDIPPDTLRPTTVRENLMLSDAGTFLGLGRSEQREAMREAGGGSQGVMPQDILGAALKMITPPPLVRSAIEGVTDPVIDKLLPDEAAGVAQGVRDVGVEVVGPIAAFKMAPAIGKGLLAAFGGQYAWDLPEQKAQFNQALAQGRKKDAYRIATTSILNGLLIGAGSAVTAKQALARKPQRISDTDLTAPEIPEGVDPDTIARNLATPGTVRPSEIPRFGPPETTLEAPAFSVGDVPFERMQRFGGQELPPVEILPQMGRLPDVEILSEPRSLLERETRGKASFGASAPTLLRNAQELPPALTEAIQRAEGMGLRKSVEAKAEVQAKVGANKPITSPELAPTTAPAAAPRVRRTFSGELHQVWVKLPNRPEVNVGAIQTRPEVGTEAGAIKAAESYWHFDDLIKSGKSRAEAQEIINREAAPAPTAREPWEMTKDEWHDENLDVVVKRRPDKVHRASVEKALREGRPVPPEVLAEYPDLKAKPAPASTSEAIASIETLGNEEAGALKQRPAVEAGIKLTPEDVPALEKARDAAKEKMIAALEASDDATFKAEYGKNIWFSGAIEGANKKGPNYDVFAKERMAGDTPIVMEATKAEAVQAGKPVDITEAEFTKNARVKVRQDERGEYGSVELEKGGFHYITKATDAKTAKAEAYQKYINRKPVASTPIAPTPSANPTLGIRSKNPLIESETIKAAAVRTENGTIYTGKWHPAAYDELMSAAGITKEQIIKQLSERQLVDGFLTSSGRFVSREEAATIASKSNQFRPDKEGDIAFAGGLKGLEDGPGKVAPASLTPETVTKWSETVTKVTPDVTKPPLTDLVSKPESLKFDPGAPALPAPTPSANPTLGIMAKNPIIDIATDTILSGEWWKKNFTAAGSLPKAVHDKWVASRGKISAETKEIDYAKRDLYSALREIHNVSKGSEMVGGLKNVPTSAVVEINRALMGEIPIASLPPKLQAPIQKMRDHIDRLSFDLIDRGLIDTDLAVKVGNNLGTYLTRSYRIFDDPKWVESIPASIRQNAENYLWTELRRTNPTVPVEVAQTKLRELLQDWSESGIDKQMRAGKLGSKDLTQFMKRGDVPPELREVMGEYKDPVINYARSITKIARFIGDQEFLSFVKNDGLGNYLFPEGQSKAGFEAQLAADGSSAMAPLNGLRTSPLLKEAFENFQKGQVNDNWFLQKYFQINAISKGAKTVGSWLTQARNLVGQPFFNLMSGDVGLNTPKNYATAIKAIASDIGLKNDVAWRDYYKNLRERGIAHESAKAQELRDALKDAGLKDTQIEGIGEQGYSTAARKVFLDAPSRLYEISDEIGKIVGYESKKKMLQEANPKWAPEQVEVAAADRVRNTYPTYSKVPESIKQLRRQPLWGPFISFPYEVFRTSFHNMRYALEDARSGNPVLQKQAAKQAAGMLTVLGSGYALSQASKALQGVSGDKEKDIRRFAPKWDKNAQLIFTGTDSDGAVKYVNWSYQNPYSYLSDPFVAFANSDEKDLFQRSVKTFGEFLRPFTSEQMLSASVMDVSRNKTQTGREIYNEQDDWDTKWRKAAAHVATAVEPGTTQRLRTKIIPAATDSQPDYGRKLDLQTELTSELTGFKQQRLDFPQALKYKAREFGKQEQNAEHKFTGAVGRTGTVPTEELIQAYHEGDQARFQLWKDMHLDMQAAIRNGVSEGDALRALMENGIGRKEAGLILQGLYVPQPISRNAVQAAQKFGRELPMRELELYRDARIAIPLK